MAYPNGFEPSAHSVGGYCSIQLSYGRIFFVFYFVNRRYSRIKSAKAGFFAVVFIA